MTALEEKTHLHARLEHIAQIAVHPEAFKACDQCRSLVQKSSAHCPFCAAYRFVEDVEFIRATLEEMAQHAVPVGAPVVPRIVSAKRPPRRMDVTARIQFVP